MLEAKMGIYFDQSNSTFHLQAKDTSYVMQIVKSRYLAHLYWGKKIRQVNFSNPIVFADRPLSPNPDASDRLFSLDTVPQEYPAYGTTDFRMPAYHVQLENGTTITDLIYKTHKIIKGKPMLDGLPATYMENMDEGETLEIILEDALIGLEVVLSYTVFEKYNAITRSARFINRGEESCKLLQALSMSVDFRDDQFDLLQLSGAWSRERQVIKRALVPGIQSIDSRRGASSPQQNPFLALLRKDATEESGEVFGFSFVYSGNFLAQAEVDQYSSTRISLGINPFDFSWLLTPGESFQTPEAVLVYSYMGLGDMSRTYHNLYRTRLCRGEFRDKERPVLINNWEATYFDFNKEKIIEIAEVGKELGMELFVLDDGWFGKRDNDASSLGDWFVHKEKLPLGLENLVKEVKGKQMQFGLWFEPEMVSPDSELYRSHPDWCLHVPNRGRSEGRHQLVLDFSRPDVCNAIIAMISDILSSAEITYVKWDMNRHMTEIGSALLPKERQRETAHRYILGLYRVMEELTTAFPHVLFESCSSGGGRFDPGMLYYMPQTWTSDNTDAVSRIGIQYGTSLVYPISATGAHVSAVPNHQVHRFTSLKMRGDVAMSGNFGYELDLTALSDEEKSLVKEQVAAYKEIRHLIQFGDFYRLLSPFEGNEAAWMFVSQDKLEAYIVYFRILAIPNPPLRSLRLKGLDETMVYICNEMRYGGDELMHMGLHIPDFTAHQTSFSGDELKGDFQSMVWRVHADN